MPHAIVNIIESVAAVDGTTFERFTDIKKIFISRYHLRHTFCWRVVGDMQSRRVDAFQMPLFIVITIIIAFSATACHGIRRQIRCDGIH